MLAIQLLIGVARPLEAQVAGSTSRIASTLVTTGKAHQMIAESLARGFVQNRVGNGSDQPEHAAEQETTGNSRRVADLVARGFAVERRDHRNVLQRIDGIEQVQEADLA